MAWFAWIIKLGSGISFTAANGFTAYNWIFSIQNPNNWIFSIHKPNLVKDVFPVCTKWQKEKGAQ